MSTEHTTYDPAIEDRLRRELAGADLLDLDLPPLLEGGRRALRRRRIAQLGGTTVAGLAIAVGAYAVPGDRARDAAPVPPGVTTQVTTPTTVMLDPLDARIGGNDGEPTIIPGPTTFAVTIDPGAAADEPNLIYSAVDESGARTMLGGSAVDLDGPGIVTWGTSGPDSHAIVGVVPARAQALSIVTPDDPEGGHGVLTTHEEIPGTGWAAFAAKFQVASDVEDITSVLWWDGAGQVFDQSGAAVPTVTLADDDGTVAYLSRDAGRLGTFSTSGNATSTSLTRRPAASPRPVLSQIEGDDSGSGTGLFVLVVPSGSSAPTLETGGGSALTADPAIVELPDGAGALLWATFRTEDAGSGGISRASWTEPDGRRVSESAF